MREDVELSLFHNLTTSVRYGRSSGLQINVCQGWAEILLIYGRIAGNDQTVSGAAEKDAIHRFISFGRKF